MSPCRSLKASSLTAPIIGIIRAGVGSAPLLLRALTRCSGSGGGVSCGWLSSGEPKAGAGGGGLSHARASGSGCAGVTAETILAIAAGLRHAVHRLQNKG